jgi:hypothetical protein
METELITANKKPVRKYLIVLIIFISAFFIYYSIMTILSPVKKLESLTNEYSYKQNEKNKIDERIFSDSTYLKLLREKAFLQSRIAIAGTDSIYLTINLPDSLINLEISGISVHKTRILKQNISKILKAGNEYIISTMFSRPFTIANNYSSIEKEPLMIKMAPKDTSEYQPDIIPDTADYEPVNYIMEVDNGTRIYIYQEEKLNHGDGFHQMIFDFRMRYGNLIQSLGSVFTFKIPEYHPYIKIRIPRADAKIIYRALPEHAQIAVYR